MEPATAIQPVVRKVKPAGIAGLAIALVALAAAALSPWALDAIQPQTKPIDEVAADLAGRITDRLVAKAKGQEYIAPVEPQRADWSKWYSGSVIGAGVLAVCIGVIGLVCRHDGRLNLATVAVGTSAIILQYALMIVVALLLILLVGLILSALGGGT